jgi:hypothetical protein
MSTAKRIIALLLCISVFAGIFTTASYAFPFIGENTEQAEAAPEEEEKAPDTPVTVFGLFEVSPAMGRIIDAFPAILVFITPFLMFYEIPYVVKDIFTSLKNRIAD